MLTTRRSIHRTAVVALACLVLVVAGPAAAEQQDLRSPDAAAAQLTQDLRSPDAADAAPSTQFQVPAVHATDSGGGLDWTTIALGIAGGLLVIGGIVAVAVHGRRVSRPHVSA